MSEQDDAHDPVGAMTEAEASGEIAITFADIRDTMQIPLLTSIWRILAADEFELRSVWNAVRPVYNSSAADVLLEESHSKNIWPVAKRSPDHIKAMLPPKDFSLIRSILDAYNRSNTLNMLTLTRLIDSSASDSSYLAGSRKEYDWPELPPLLKELDMSVETWTSVLALNEFGARPDQTGLASLWRHLAHWPEVLEFIRELLQPLQDAGEIDKSINLVQKEMSQQARRLPPLDWESIDLRESTRKMIERYVHHPGLVIRMVVIGHCLAKWLNREEN